jgi:hypothetical protein
MFNVVMVAISWVGGTSWVLYRMRGATVLSRAEAESARRQSLGREPNDLPSMIRLVRLSDLYMIVALAVMCGLLMWGAVNSI